jgi:hypothetical protein
MRALVAYHLAGGGFGQAQDVIAARTGVTVGRAQLAGLAEDLAAWTGDFYEQRARDADGDLPDSDVLMMQADGKGIALRPEHRKDAGKADAAHPGIKKMAEIVAVADFTPAAREPEDIAAPPARRQAHPGPKARDKWVAASITSDIPAMIAEAFDEADRRDPPRVRQRIFLVDGNKQQITAIQAQAGERGLKVPVLIDFIHVAGYLGKAAAALHPGDPQAAGQWADGQKLRVLHGRAKAVAATLASVAAKARSSPRTRHLDLTDLDKAVPYLSNNHQHMRYDKALANGWPIATGMIEGAEPCPTGQRSRAGYAVGASSAPVPAPQRPGRRTAPAPPATGPPRTPRTGEPAHPTGTQKPQSVTVRAHLTATGRYS